LKLSQLINYPLRLVGLKLGRAKSAIIPVNQSDILADKQFMAVYQQVSPFTIVEIERCYALYAAMQYIIRNNIPGDLAECGVMKGGSAMLMAICLQQAGITDRKIYLYDTFEGMTKPGQMDGEFELKEWERMKVSEVTNKWCYSSLEEAENNLKSTGYPMTNFIFLKGKVEETLPDTIPEKLCILRLDTDWYESTMQELKYLYPVISSKGVLLIDDYGAWQGARKAVDEYFSDRPGTFLHRIDWTGRLLIKD
jgi:O-methyltransferase